MHVDRVTYKRTWNLGDYESVSLEASVSLDDGDNPADAWAMAKAEVATQSAPVIDWRDKRRAMDAQHIIDGLPAHLREPVRAMVSTTYNRIEHNGNGEGDTCQ